MFRFFKGDAKPADPSKARARGDFEAALQTYRRELNRRPLQAAVIHKKIAETLIQAGRSQEAVESYLAAAAAHEKDGRGPQAMALYKAAHRIDPKHPELARRLAAVASEPAERNPALSPQMTLRTKLRIYVPLFSEFSNEELTGIVGCMQSHRHPAGTVVFRQGDHGESLYIVAQGEILLQVTGQNGDPVEVARLTDGSVFGEVSVLDGAPRNVTATTTRTTELLELRRDYLEALSIEHPHIWQVLEAFQKKRGVPVGI